MTAAYPAPSGLRAAEQHRFLVEGRQFTYLVPSGGIFELSAEAAAVLDGIGANTPVASAFDTEALTELFQVRAIETQARHDEAPQVLPEPFPLQSLVLNITNQCNLSCKYCYEFGEDRVATPEGKPKFMTIETAQAAVDMLLNEARGRRAVHVTFFGGETLMNFPLLRQVVAYARERAHERGLYIDFSLTTNATLLTPAIIEFLAAEQIGVTVSIDGGREANDSLRVFGNGRGSYDVIAPRIRALLDTHKTRPIAARVTLTSGNADVLGIFKHLTHEIGFYEVGFAPVTTAPNRLYSINATGLNSVLEQFTILGNEYLEHALRGEYHGFSNVSDTIAELHQGVSKSHPCGAGLGLLGVGPSGDIAPCHRFVDADAHALGNVATGIDRDRQRDFLTRGHIARKDDCSKCWARPVCSGGCYHEAFVRYGDTGRANLHYCDWIRGWTDLCLRIYAAISVRNPSFLRFFDERKEAAA